MIKVLIQQEQITPYRLDIFNLISKHYDLTVIHQGPLISKKRISFKQKIKKTYKIGPFFFQNIFKISRMFDVVITTANLRFLNNYFLAISTKNFKGITWGIGVSASYRKKFDNDKKYDFFRYLIFGRSDALLFYSNYPIKKYLNMGLKKSKLFVANNTYHNQCNFSENRKYFIFIGSLIEGKGLMSLIKQYESALSIIGKNLLPLKIIGGGKLEKPIKKYLDENNLNYKIELLGPIFKKKIINTILKKALISISPNQAGLAVLHSMSCGVAFVTSKDSITGGEIFNIKKNYNGIIYKEHDELHHIMIDACKKPLKYLRMGRNAHKYYYENRSGDRMIDGFRNVIDYVLKTSTNNKLKKTNYASK